MIFLLEEALLVLFVLPHCALNPTRPFLVPSSLWETPGV